jgi:hypothetical protein
MERRMKLTLYTFPCQGTGRVRDREDGQVESHLREDREAQIDEDCRLGDERHDLEEEVNRVLDLRETEERDREGKVSKSKQEVKEEQGGHQRVCCGHSIS